MGQWQPDCKQNISFELDVPVNPGLERNIADASARTVDIVLHGDRVAPADLVDGTKLGA